MNDRQRPSLRPPLSPLVDAPHTDPEAVTPSEDSIPPYDDLIAAAMQLLGEQLGPDALEDPRYRQWLLEQADEKKGSSDSVDGSDAE